MPNAADPRLTGGVQLPLTHNPLQRINYQTPNPILDPAAIAAAEEAAIEAFLQLLKTTTGIDLTGFWESLQQASANAQTALQQLSAIIQGIFGAAGTPFDFTAWLQQVETNASNAWNELEAFFATGDWDDLTAAFDDLFGISYTANNNATAALQQWSALIQGILGGGGTPFDLATFLNNTWTQLTNTWNDFWNGIFGTSATGKTSSDVLTAAGSVSSTANTASTNATSALSQWTAAITAAGQATATAFGTFVSNTWSNLTTTWNSIWNGTYGTSATGKTASDVQTATAATSSTANTASTNASSALSQWAAALTAAGQATATALGTFVTNTWTQLGTTWNSIWNGTYGTSATGKTATDVQTAAGSVSSTANTASTNATSALSQFTSMLTAAGQATATAVGTALSTAVTNLQSTWNAFWNGTYGTSVTGKTASDVQTAAAATASTANTASTNATSAGTSASSALTQLSAMLTAAGQSTATAIGNFISTTSTNLTNTWNSFWNGTFGTSATGKTATDVQTAAAATASTANTAGTNATSALSTASSASSTATTASTDASTALTNAAAAATSASTAQSTADSATSLATRVPQNNIVVSTGSGASSVTVDAAGSGGSVTGANGSINGSLGATGTQTVGASASVVVASVTYSLVGSVGVTGHVLADVNGQHLQSLGAVQIGSSSQYLAFLLLWEPTAGSNLPVSVTVAATGGGVASVSFETTSYIGASAASTLSQASGSGSSLSQTVAAATGNMVVQAFSAADVALKNNTALSAYNKTQRGNVTVQVNSTQYGYQSLILGDAVGAASVSFTATGADSSAQWVGAAIVLSAQTIPGSAFRQHVASTSTVLVSSGNNVASVFSGAVTDYCSSDLTLSIVGGQPVITVGLAGTYVVTVGILEASTFTSHYTRATVYKNSGVAKQGQTLNVSATAANTWMIQSTFILECAADDTIQPGYWSSATISSLHTGESTGTCTYWEVALANRSLL